MKTTFITYEHSTIGFPKIVLKWSETNGIVDPRPRLVKNGLIVGHWFWHNPNPIPFYDGEMDLFDDYIRKTYSEDASVQG